MNCRHLSGFQIVRISTLSALSALDVEKKAEQRIRAYYFGSKRGAYVDVPSIRSTTHDFTCPDVRVYLNTTITRADLAFVEGKSRFVIYWSENTHDPVNPKLLDRTGIAFRGKVLVFKRRVNGTRLVNLCKGDDERALRVVAGCVCLKTIS